MMRLPSFLTILALAGALCSGPAQAADAKAIATKVARPVASQPTTRRLSPPELVDLTRIAIATSGARLPKGATITQVRATASAEVPLTRDRATIEIVQPPHRAGSVTTTAVVTFWRANDVTARLPIVIDLSVPPEALVFELVKGAPVTLVVRRGLVEVTAPAVLSVDADVGDIVQVLLRPSGRAMRAHLVAKDRAVALEDGQ